MDAYTIANISNSEQDTYAGEKYVLMWILKKFWVPKLESRAVDTEKAAGRDYV